MITDVEREFLEQSNFIEDERSMTALLDAIEAWEYIENVPSMKMHHVIEAHRLLMRNLDPRIAGRLRNVNVRVGMHSCPDHLVVFDRLHGWTDRVNRSPNGGRGPDKWAEMLHVSFEKLHPFEDGNGRVGRILWNWHRKRLGLPVKVVHEGEEQFAYYKIFR